MTKEIELRDYLAAHAPEAPEHFKPIMEEPCPFPEYDLSSIGARKDEKKSTEIFKWLDKQKMQRIIQWPYFYADAMLKTRKQSHIEEGEKR